MGDHVRRGDVERLARILRLPMPRPKGETVLSLFHRCIDHAAVQRAELARLVPELDAPAAPRGAQDGC